MEQTTVEESQRWFVAHGWHFDNNKDFVDKDGKFFDYPTQGQHYEYLQEQIRDLVFKEMETNFDLEQHQIPKAKGQKPPVDEEEKKEFDVYCPTIFTSKDATFKPNLLVIVQGLGMVPPGQWARKLFTNGLKDQYKLATQMPYIEKAQKHEDWGLVLCDPNHASPEPKTEDTRAHHVLRVWQDVVAPSKAKNIMYIGFSAGTVAVLDLYDTLSVRPEFVKRVKAIALLDGESGASRQAQGQDGKWLQDHSRAYCQKGMSGFLGPNSETVNTHDHDSVPGLAVDSVFEFLDEMLQIFGEDVIADKEKSQ
ncbi:hypothetical protein EMPS_03636 [Entomortierella parvispora]|uniref:Arb2 domain-containing protein n=1 Tax=Entomortierella parvispora TaxID=205924 RepID=A0A9P3H713_9FUNG|nr:hypothetical protein EMPS_03636 [Entomortierella parvispora]